MLLALAVALPFVLLTGGIVWQLANNERETRREAILFSTRTLMNAVDAILGKQIAVAQMLATSPAFESDDLHAFRDEAQRGRCPASRAAGSYWPTRADTADESGSPSHWAAAATAAAAWRCNAAPSRPARSNFRRF